MIDIKDLRDNPDRYRQAVTNKRIGVDIDRLLSLDAELRALMTKQQHITAEKNQSGKVIGQLAGKLKKASDAEKAALQAEMQKLQARPAELKEQEQALAEQIAALEPEHSDLLHRVPMPADPEVPVGKDDTQNVELRTWGEVPTFDFEIKDHVTLGTALGMIDVERGVKLAGSRSYFLLGAGAMLQQAVLRFAMDMMIDRGFTPMNVPVIVREQPMLGTGYFPLGREQSYALTNEDPAMYLVGTSEVSLTAFHMDETLDAAALPRKYVAGSSCFRREAGTYGKDTHGLYRIHQFEKVEQVVICRADEEESKRWHHEILSNAEALLQALKLPYRVVMVCTGDLGQGQVCKYDIETWMPSRNSYGETHSASRFYDFQARRLNLRYRELDADGKPGKPVFCHTLNNTVVASPRILIPIMEQYQNADGSITVPDVLRPYMRGMEHITQG